MKSLYKRAQTATEYLIILAVVIIIALIVVGVLGGIPGIGGSTGSNINSAYWQTSDIGIDSLAVSATVNSDTIVVRNNLPNNIVINSVHIGTTALTTATAASRMNTNLSAASSYDLSTPFTGSTILAGRTLTLAGNFSGHLSLCSSAGDSASVYFLFNYTDSETSADYTFNGDAESFDVVCAT